MLPLNAHKERGVTLTETLVGLAISGMLAAVVIPNFQGMYNRSRIDAGLTEVEGAIKQVQREAMRRGKTCRVTLHAGQNKVINDPDPPSSDDCLLSERDLSKIDPKLKMKHTGGVSTWTYNFSYRGNMAGGGRTTVIYWEGQGNSATTYKRCLVMTNGTGILRTGYYEGPVSSIDKDNCKQT